MGNSDYIDPDRSACLCDVGHPDYYLAALVVGPDGEQRLILAQRDSIGDPDVTYDANCSSVAHEQLGPLPLEFVRRLTVSRRVNRCNRRTKSGASCQTPVARPGDACGWHREGAHA